MGIIYREGEILCTVYTLILLLIWMGSTRLPPPTGVAVEVWSTALPDWRSGVGVEVDPAAYVVIYGTNIT